MLVSCVTFLTCERISTGWTQLLARLAPEVLIAPFPASRFELITLVRWLEGPGEKTRTLLVGGPPSAQQLRLLQRLPNCQVVPRTERTGILAASWLSSKWPHRAPPDHVLMRARATISG